MAGLHSYLVPVDDLNSSNVGNVALCFSFANVRVDCYWLIAIVPLFTQLVHLGARCWGHSVL